MSKVPRGVVFVVYILDYFNINEKHGNTAIIDNNQR